MNNYGVIDLFSDCSYTLFEAKGKTDVSRKQERMLAPLIVCPENYSSNRSPYLMDSNNISLDDIVKNGKLDFSCVHSVENMLHAMNDETDYIAGRTEGYDIQSDVNAIGTWFQKTSAEIHKHIMESDEIFPKSNIVTVPDNFSVAAQSCMIKAAKHFEKPILLWRSVAACLGAAESISKYHLKANSRVMVIDNQTTGLTVSILKMHELDGRLIPGHRLFIDCNTGNRKKEFYPESYPHKASNAHMGQIPYEIDSDGFLKKHYDLNYTYRKPLSFRHNVDLIIEIGDIPFFNNLYTPVIQDPEGSLVTFGAGRFANMNQSDIISYYDECDGLGIVIRQKNDDLMIKPLIKASETIPGGKQIKEAVVEGIKLQRGTSSVKFLLVMGTLSKSAPLRELEQIFSEHIDGTAMNMVHDIPLVLNPSMQAGQGYAHVWITAKNTEDRKSLKPLDLNFREMKTAERSLTRNQYSSLDTDSIEINIIRKEGSNRIVNDTVELMEIFMQRAFPATVPPVIAGKNFGDIRYALENYMPGITSMHRLDMISDSTFPNKWAPGIEQFQRFNYFGSPKSELDLPPDPSDRMIAIQFFKNLAYAYSIEHDKTEKNRIISKIGWTYHSEYFEAIIEEILTFIEDAASNTNSYYTASVPTQYFTVCGNLIEDDTQLARFMKAFIRRLDANYENMNNWLRGAHLVLMYHTEFIGSSYIEESDYINCMKNMINYYRLNINNYNDRQIRPRSVIKVMIFLMKVRIFYPEFCSKNSDNRENVELYYELCRLTSPNSFTKDYELKQLKQMLFEFVTGEGNLSLPMPD